VELFSALPNYSLGYIYFYRGGKHFRDKGYRWREELFWSNGELYQKFYSFCFWWFESGCIFIAAATWHFPGRIIAVLGISRFWFIFKGGVGGYF